MKCIYADERYSLDEKMIKAIVVNEINSDSIRIINKTMKLLIDFQFNFISFRSTANV